MTTANWQISEMEYILIRIWATIGSFVLGWVFTRSIFPGLGLAFIGFLLPSILLNRSISQRRMKFQKQLVDVLVLITGAVRAGYSFLQSMDVVVQEMQPPVSVEFQRVRREVGLGFPLSEALTNLHARMQNEDIYLVITAININSQVGGNLTTMLDVVTNTIRLLKLPVTVQRRVAAGVLSAGHARARVRRHHRRELVALLDRPDQRTVQLDVDYSAFVVGDGRFIGYGLEFEGRGANLPYIAKV